MISGTAFTGNGAGLTSLEDSQLANGIGPDSLLPANVARLNGNNEFTGINGFNPKS